MKRLLIVAASALVLVLAACGGSQRVPKGVTEIDIRAPGRIFRNTGPAQRIPPRRAKMPSMASQGQSLADKKADEIARMHAVV